MLILNLKIKLRKGYKMTSTQVLELEKNFKRYKIKKFIKKAILAGFVLSLCGVGFYANALFNKQQESLKIAHLEQKDMQKRLEKAKIAAQKAEILSKKREEKAQIAQQEATQKQSKIIIKSYDIDPNDLKKTFYNKPDLSTALNLASFHLSHQDYKKALFWSLKANELNKNEPRAWLIFAKAKFAQGKKDEARKALQGYINFYGKNFDEDVSHMLK